MRALMLLILLIPIKSLAFDDYDVDWSPDRDSGMHVLRITIDGCETLFKIKDKDFYIFAKSKAALDQALDKAIEHKDHGCR